MTRRISSLILTSIALFAINNLSKSNAQDTKTLPTTQLPPREENFEKKQDEANHNNHNQLEQTLKQPVNKSETKLRQPPRELSGTEGKYASREPKGFEGATKELTIESFIASAVNYTKEEILGLVALITAAISLKTSIRTDNSTKAAVKELEKLIQKKLKINNTYTPNPVDLEADLNNARLQDLNSRLKAIELKSKHVPIEPSAGEIVTKTIKPMQAPTAIDEPKKPTKEELITALNAGDRQQLRDASKCQLNITSWSENEIIMGKSTTTELEEVVAGGSYLLVMINNEHWLFPTEQTLKGFTAAQRAKRIFECEEKINSNPQLLEPALLEKSANNWKVKQLGRIYTPKV